MKRIIFGAFLFGAAALGLAGAANAANDNQYDFLYGSTDALVLGPTGIPTPSANYISNGIDLYLGPLGYNGTLASTLPLTMPNTFDFLNSVPQGASHPRRRDPGRLQRRGDGLRRLRHLH